MEVLLQHQNKSLFTRGLPSIDTHAHCYQQIMLLIWFLNFSKHQHLSLMQFRIVWKSGNNSRLPRVDHFKPRCNTKIASLMKLKTYSHSSTFHWSIERHAQQELTRNHYICKWVQRIVQDNLHLLTLTIIRNNDYAYIWWLWHARSYS